MGRVLAIAYVVIILAVAQFGISDADSDPRYVAALNLSRNTRLVEAHLSEPAKLSASGRLHLAGERRQLVGKYLRSNTAKGETLDTANVLAWPDLGDILVTQVPVETEPDFRVLNQGARALVMVGDEPRQATVVAVTLSQGKWYALFPAQDLGDVFEKEPKIGRLLSLPGPSAAPVSPPAASSREAPAKPAPAPPATVLPAAPVKSAPVSGATKK